MRGLQSTDNSIKFLTLFNNYLEIPIKIGPKVGLSTIAHRYLPLILPVNVKTENSFTLGQRCSIHGDEPKSTSKISYDN